VDHALGYGSCGEVCDVTKREIVDRIRQIDRQIHAALATTHTLEEERAMLRELLAEWPDGGDALAALDREDQEEPPDTEPGTPRTKSSQRMAAVTLPPPDDEEPPPNDCE
jgi:hypothetical protein